ncbi:hypothetical protein Tco_1107849 [Tanacetum coccineum]
MAPLLCKYGHDQASKGSKSSCGNFGIAKSWITCVNTNRNTMLSEAHGVSLRITFDVRVRLIPRNCLPRYLSLEASFRSRGRSWGEKTLNKSDLCPSFIEGLTAKGWGLRVGNSHNGNH